MVFEFTVQQQGNKAIISMGGNLVDKSQANELLEKSAELVQSGCFKWAINLENLIYMNSSGLNTLIQLLTKARVAGGEAVLYNMNKKINELILITKLHTLFKVVGSEDEALKVLGE